MDVCFELIRCFVLGFFFASLQDALHEHLTDDDRAKVKGACKEAEDWLSSHLDRQSRLPLTADPAVRIEDIEQTRRVRGRTGMFVGESVMQSVRVVNALCWTEAVQ